MPALSITLIIDTIAGIINTMVNALIKPIGTILGVLVDGGGVIGVVIGVLIAVIPTVNGVPISAAAMIMVIIVVFVIPLIIAIEMPAVIVAVS